MSTIKRIVATEVIVHAHEGYVDRPAFGPSLFDKPSKWMIEMFTDDGLIGYGETLRRTGLSDVQWAAQQVLGKHLRTIHWGNPLPPDLSTQDALGHMNPPVPHRMYEREFGLSRGGIGVCIAIQDLIAKSVGLRLCELFGGAHREAVATDWWIGRSDGEHAARQMEIGLKRGYNSLKMKAAAEDDLVGVVRAVKKVAGEHTRIVIDPNQRFYRLCEAVRIARELEGFTNVVFEDPFPFDIEEWRLFRQKTTIPLTLHGAGAAHVGLANHCCDYVNLGYPAQRFLGDAHMARKFGALCWGGSGVELGVFDAYMLHYAAAAPNCVLPGDAFGHDLRVDDLIVEKLQAKDGAIALPQAPGLGVTIDHAAMKKHMINRWEAEA